MAAADIGTGDGVGVPPVAKFRVGDRVTALYPSADNHIYSAVVVKLVESRGAFAGYNVKFYDGDSKNIDAEDVFVPFAVSTLFDEHLFAMYEGNLTGGAKVTAVNHGKEPREDAISVKWVDGSIATLDLMHTSIYGEVIET